MKDKLRTKMRHLRQNIAPEEKIEKSRTIRKTLENTKSFQTAERILFYASKQNEVSTTQWIQDALAAGKKIYLPKVNNDHLLICPIQSWEDLKEGSFGILEPCENLEPSHPKELDLILVPGLAFDKKGNRMGYGKGFYDRLLKQTKALRIGLAFKEQIVDELPVEDHDEAVDLVITDETIIHP